MRFKPLSGPCVEALLVGSGQAVFFIFLELLKAERASQWGGLLLRHVVGLAMALVVYTVVLAVGFAMARMLVDRVRPGALGAARDAVSLLLSGAVVWVLLSLHREQTPTLDDAVVGCALLTFATSLVVSLRVAQCSLRFFGLLLAAAGLSGVTALASAGEYFLFDPARADRVTRYPVAWLCFSGILLFAVYLLTHRRALSFVVAVLCILLPPLALTATLYRPARDAAEARPNMVFLIADTLRADYCSVYGGQVPTPNLEQLARGGTRFKQSYSLAPWTLPSMTGLFTSQYPRSLTPGSGHGVWSLQMNQYEVDTTEPTFPMRLEAAGYATGAMTANAFLPVIPGMMFGYQTRASSHPILLREEGWLTALPFLGALVREWFPALADIRPHNTTRAIAHYASAFIKRHRDRPFFLWIHYIDPHAPYDPPESLRRVHEGPWPFFHPYAGGEEWGIPILGKNFAVEEPDRDYVKALYEGEVAYIDQYAGNIIDALESAGVREQTYICFTSDHGEELWDHGEWGHGHALYEEQLHVPLLFTGPDIQVRDVAAPVSAIDLLPTLADLMQLTPSPSWRGESLVPTLKGGALPPPKPIFVQGTTNKTETPFHAVIHGGYKLIQTAGTGERVLYDLNSDPEERHDRAADLPEKVAELGKLLEDWLGSFPAFFEADPVEFNRDLEQGLEGMGYL